MTGLDVNHPGAAQRAPGSIPSLAVSVATINQVLKEVVEGAFMPLWVRGEVSDFKHHRNGHWYFALRDGSAQLQCVTWSRDQRRIPAAPRDGMQVTVFGQLSVFANRGDVQFSVRQMEAEGAGLWRKALEETKARLEADGLLAPSRKRPLPSMPERIAVITSPDGAALHDIIHVVARRSPGVSIILVPARVQGEGAADELRRAVERVSRWSKADLVIIGRGGGSREDLWCFNDERLARAIAACPLPTISAVGHEVDSSICDLVADFCAATPSAAAEAAVPAVGDLRAQLRSRAAYMRRGLVTALRSRSDRIRMVRRTLSAFPARQIQRRDVQLRSLASRIQDLSPLSVLARGFGVAQNEGGKTMSRTADFAAGEQFRLRLHDGSVMARTERVDSDGENESNVI